MAMRVMTTNVLSADRAGGVGTSMASRWPLGEVREVDLPFTDRTGDFPWAAAVVAEVLTEDSPLRRIGAGPGGTKGRLPVAAWLIRAGPIAREPRTG